MSTSGAMQVAPVAARHRGSQYVDERVGIWGRHRRRRRRGPGSRGGRRQPQTAMPCTSSSSRVHPGRRSAAARSILTRQSGKRGDRRSRRRAYMALSQSNGTVSSSSVLRFNGSSWVTVASGLNLSPSNNSSSERLTDVGGVPYVVWLEGSPTVQCFFGDANGCHAYVTKSSASTQPRIRERSAVAHRRDPRGACRSTTSAYRCPWDSITAPAARSSVRARCRRRRALGLRASPSRWRPRSHQRRRHVAYR